MARSPARRAPLDASTLVLNPGRSGQPAGHLWFVDYDVVLEGMPLEGARVVFRVNNGNLIQYGSENLPAPGAKVPPTGGGCANTGQIAGVSLHEFGHGARPSRCRSRSSRAAPSP